MSENADFFPLSILPGAESPSPSKTQSEGKGTKKSEETRGREGATANRDVLAGIERDRQEFVSKPHYAQKNIPFGDRKTSAETTSAENSIDLPQSRVRKIKSWGCT